MTFICFLALYIGALVLLQPGPGSPKHWRGAMRENVRAVRATLVLGSAMLTVFFLTSNFTFSYAHYDWLRIFALQNDFAYPVRRLMQIVSHIFVHLDLAHVFANVVMLAALSLYERRVGCRRFLAVFMVSGVASSASVLFYEAPMMSAGASGAIFGLAAAYFADIKGVTLTQRLSALTLGVILVLIDAFFQLILAFLSTFIAAPWAASAATTPDHIAHAIGALTGLIYVLLVPSKQHHPYKKSALA
ncbi:MAG: rhomboid family intramembrane serine protease [Pseudomonadota bacterium]